MPILLDYEIDEIAVDNEVCRCLYCGCTQNACECAGDSSTTDSE